MSHHLWLWVQSPLLTVISESRAQEEAVYVGTSVEELGQGCQQHMPCLLLQQVHQLCQRSSAGGAQKAELASWCAKGRLRCVYRSMH